MVDTAASIFRDYVTDGVPSSGKQSVVKASVREWGTYVESLATLSFTNGKVYATKAAMDADLVPASNTSALVSGDGANDGLYMKVGATGVGSWTRLLDFVPGAQIVHAVDAGAGTPNAIVATSTIGLSTSGSQIVRLDVFEANTSSPVTVAFNGGSALTVKTAAGNDVVAGGLTAGPVLGTVSGSTFRLLSDQASAAIVAAAEAQVTLAAAQATFAAAQAGLSEDARDLAQQYASDAATVSGVNVPIYAAVASAEGATIVAGVKSIQTQFRAPTYTVPGTLIGGARYGRWSKVDIDAATLPALAYFRSTDRFMPDGSTDATNGGYWVISEPVIHIPMLGALTGVGNVTATTAALAAASTLGRPTFVPPIGDFYSTQITVQSHNWDLYGDGSGSSIVFTTADQTGILAAAKNGLRVTKLKLTGATGTGSAESGAIYATDCDDFVFSDLEITNWPDHGIFVGGTPSTFAVAQRGYIERCHIHSPQALTRFNSAGISLPDNARDITVRGNIVDGGVLNPGDGGLVVGIFCQGISSAYNGGPWGIKILDNIVRHCSAYGISSYDNKTLVNVTGAADNGSGAIRLTAVAHGLNSDEEISVEGVTGTVEANGVWLVDVIDSDTIDLRYSAFVNAYVSGGTIQYLFQGDMTIEGNTIEYIDGSPSAQNISNGNFGAGIYLVGTGRTMVRGNTIRYTNIGTTASSLTPAGIGVNGNYGAVTVIGNIVEDCEWYGIYSPDARPSVSEGELIISGNQVQRCRLTQIYCFDRGTVTIDGNTVRNRPNVAGSQGIVVDATAAIQDVTITGNRIETFGVTRMLRTNYVNGLVCTNNQVKNSSPATVTSEAAYFQNGDGGTIAGNVFDGGASTYTAFTINACLNYTIEANRMRMTGSAAARAVAVMTGTCTGSRFGKSNIADINGGSGGIRMDNSSTGGSMETTGGAAPNTKTRQVGDVHWNDAPAAAGTILSAVTTAGNPPTWKAVALAA